MGRASGSGTFRWKQLWSPARIRHTESSSYRRSRRSISLSLCLSNFVITSSELRTDFDDKSRLYVHVYVRRVHVLCLSIYPRMCAVTYVPWPTLNPPGILQIHRIAFMLSSIEMRLGPVNDNCHTSTNRGVAIRTFQPDFRVLATDRPNVHNLRGQK